MYRIILADDEKWSIFGLSHLIDWQQYGCEIVGMAYDGLSALDMCRREKPDLLLSDIRMPGMDGLELTRTLAMELPEITVILITGYSDLSYAQNALRLGVFDFLLKQVSADDLDAVLRRYLERAATASADQEQIQKRSASFYFSFFDDANTRSVRECCEALCVQAPYRNVQVTTLFYDQAVTLPSTQIYQGGSGMSLAFYTGHQRITCYTFSDGVMPTSAELTAAFRLPPAVRAGMSDVYGLDASFYALYQQSNLAVLSAQFWQQPERLYVRRSPSMESIEQLRRALVDGSMPLAFSALDQVLASSEQLQLDALESVLGRAVALLAAFRVGDFAQSDAVDLYQYASAGGTAQELWSTLKDLLQPKSAEEDSAQQQMQRILDYIDLHFTEDIRISDVAANFYLNASYLSTLIRKRTGKTYSDIVTDKRISYAKELLRSSSMSVMEVAHQAGYHEYSHFNNVFKRITGMTPAQYRSKT